MKYLTAICLVLLTTGCGSSNSSRTGGYDYVPAESGAGGAEPTGTGGQLAGGVNGVVPGVGGTGGEPIDGTGGNVAESVVVLVDSEYGSPNRVRHPDGLQNPIGKVLQVFSIPVAAYGHY